MSSYFADIDWQREDGDFIGNRYSRGHHWHFDGGVTVPASASPHIVPLPYSVAENVDPEEAFVASLSSCHMLFFLSIAAKKKLQVESYYDKAEGMMGKDTEGRQAMLKVILRPQIQFSGGRQPDSETIQKIHHLAHENCFIANSVKTQVIVESIAARGE